MAKIDKMLEMLAARKIERAVLGGDRPFQLWTGARKVEGSVTPAAQLQEVMEEIVPVEFVPSLRDGGAFHFRYRSPHGDFDIGAENFVGVLQVTISPAKENALTPKGASYSTSSAELPVTVREPYSGAYDAGAQRPQAITPVVQSMETPLVAVASAASPIMPVVSADALSQSGIVCVTHSERTAAGVCSHSGKFYCGECLVEFDGKQYGKENLTHVFAQARQSAQVAAPTIVVNNSSHAVAQPIINTHASVSSPGPVVLSRSPKSRITAGILGIFFGGLGIHRFYLGYTGIGFLQILVTLITLGWGGLWGFVEGILLLCGVMSTDSEGRPLQS